MVEAGLLDGDYALVRRTDVARDGEIVVALIDDEEATLKYFRRDGSMIRLDPANRNHEPQRYPPMRIRIQGKHAEIGRASCRERWCTSGHIPGAPLSLKKKKP